MSFLELYLTGFGIVMIPLAILWVVSVIIRNVSIVDIFWGTGFVILGAVYYWLGGGFGSRADILMVLIAVWGFRLSFYLGWRNLGKEEDYRYQEFRQRYGPERYWWFSFFQVFLLQGVIMWLVSAPLLAGMHLGETEALNGWDLAGLIFWAIGFFFESVGDFQMARFKSKPENQGKVMDRGLWKYTRHPNYFGDAMVWWGFALFSVAVGSYLPLLSAVLMTWLLLRVSGVALLEEGLEQKKPGYREYMKKTSAFIPMPPKK